MQCPKKAYHVFFEWTMYHKNSSIFISDVLAELNYAIGKFVGENSEPLMCRLEDGVFYSSVLTMIMFHGSHWWDELLKLLIAWLKQVYTHTGIRNALSVLNYIFGRHISFTRMMNTIVSTCSTCNLRSISFHGLVSKWLLLYCRSFAQFRIEPKYVNFRVGGFLLQFKYGGI